METNDTFSSVFDIMEEISPNSHHFKWQKLELSGMYKKEGLFYEGELKLSDKKGFAKYGLTTSFLFKISSPAKKLTKVLFLRHSRAKIINDYSKKIYGILLEGYKGFVFVGCRSPETRQVWLEKLSKVSVLNGIDKEYILGKLIGSGSFASVRLGEHLKKGCIHAVKTINKERILEQMRNLQSLDKEISILRIVDHPNIVKLFSVYEDNSSVHLVLERIQGGNLYRHLVRRGAYSEGDAAMIIRGLLEALAYCHDRRIIHRDLKPENIIVDESSADLAIKIIDFGLATIQVPFILEKIRCGSPGYAAPEVLNKLGYDTKADIFSAGVILFMLLTGTSPFFGSSREEVLEKNMKGSISFTHPNWQQVSSEARDLTEKMLTFLEKDRVTAREALSHSWFQKDNLGANQLLNVQLLLSKYNEEHRFDVGKIKPDFSMITRSPIYWNPQEEQKEPALLSPTRKCVPSDIELPFPLEQKQYLLFHKTTSAPKSKRFSLHTKIEITFENCNESENFDDISEKSHDSPNRLSVPNFSYNDKHKIPISSNKKQMRRSTTFNIDKTFKNPIILPEIVPVSPNVNSTEESFVTARCEETPSDGKGKPNLEINAFQ